MGLKRDYYEEELAGKILRRASEESIQRGISREELLRSAAELGIPADLLEKAEQEVLHAAENEVALNEFRTQRRKSAIQGVFVFLAVAIGALFFDLRDGQLSWWTIFFGFWGWAAVAEYMTASNAREMQKAFEKEKELKPYMNASLEIHETVKQAYEELKAEDEDDEVDRDRLARAVSKRTGMDMEEAELVVLATCKLNPEWELDD